MPSARQRRAKMNENRESSWRPITVFQKDGGGVEKHGMAEIFANEHALADGKIETPPEDVIILEPEDIPGATVPVIPAPDVVPQFE